MKPISFFHLSPNCLTCTYALLLRQRRFVTISWVSIHQCTTWQKKSFQDRFKQKAKPDDQYQSNRDHYNNPSSRQKYNWKNHPGQAAVITECESESEYSEYDESDQSQYDDSGYACAAPSQNSNHSSPGRKLEQLAIKPPKRPPLKYPEIKCQLCSRPGHSAPNCWQLKKHLNGIEWTEVRSKSAQDEANKRKVGMANAADDENYAQVCVSREEISNLMQLAGQNHQLFHNDRDQLANAINKLSDKLTTSKQGN